MRNDAKRNIESTKHWLRIEIRGILDARPESLSFRRGGIMDCKRCAGNGVRREGGPLGICWKHQQRKCQICGAVSAGEELCITCGKAAEIKRWEAEANLKLIDPDHGDLILALRRERLMQAKFHAHRSGEVLFRGLLLSVEALWGDLESENKSEFKKVA